MYKPQEVIGVHQRTGKISKFASYQEAAREIGAGRNGAAMISACIKGTKPSAEYKGWKWYTQEQYDNRKLPKNNFLF